MTGRAEGFAAAGRGRVDGRRRTCAARTRRQTGHGATVGRPVMLHVDGLDVELRFKDVRNVNVRVRDDGSVHASAPAWMAQADVERLIAAKADWLRERQRRLADSPRGMIAQATAEEKREWRAVVQAFVPALIEKWAPAMGVEDRVGTLAFRDMTSRWGSCQPATGRICINIRLAAYPPQCLEYVVVHELCHFLERGHGPRFRALMTRFLPDWRERRALLDG